MCHPSLSNTTPQPTVSVCLDPRMICGGLVGLQYLLVGVSSHPMLNIPLVAVADLDLRTVRVAWSKVWHTHDIAETLRVILNQPTTTEVRGLSRPIPA